MLVAALTRWILCHKALVVLVWLGLTAAGATAAPRATAAMSSDFGSLPGRPGYETNQQIRRVYGNGGDTNPLVLIVQLPAGTTVDSPGVQAELAVAVSRAAHTVGGGRAVSYADGGDRGLAYLSLVAQAKAALEIPVVASLNGVSRGGWVRYASRLEAAGADALELNIYYVSSRPGLSGNDVEWHYLDVVRAVRQATRLPLAVKLSPYFSSLTNMAGQLVEAGADGLVLFNRFYQPDLDIEAMEVLPALELSTSTELRLPLRWIAILHRRHRVSLAASTGVHSATDVLKVLLAGADVAMMTSALLRNGPDHLRPLEVQVHDWMDRHSFETVEQLRGRLSQRSVPNPAAFERANYIKTLASHPVRSR